jgi:hypothetical protein
MKLLQSLLLVAFTGVFGRDWAMSKVGLSDSHSRSVRGASKTNQAPNAVDTRQHKLYTQESHGAASSAVSAIIHNEIKPTFDFIVAGFPKCGTTTLLKAFAAHEETSMADREQCAVASPQQSDALVLNSLDSTRATLSNMPGVMSSFKCPTAMYNYKSISRLDLHSPKAKYIIGMRHPVEMLQSFYNYRVTEIKERGLNQPIPTLEDVLESGNAWRGVSMQSTRFEIFLMQLGKTHISNEQMKDLVGQPYELAIKPTKAKIFLYTIDQLEDTDEERSKTFRTDMQHFLGLKKSIQPFGHENSNHVSHEESVNICDVKWESVRAKLVQQGTETAEWIRDQFIHSDDVFVANRSYFLDTLKSWSKDPCTTMAEA